MKRYLLASAFLVCFVALLPAISEAATVRGRLIHAANGYPAVGIQVTVYNQYVGRSSAAYTDANGMYYIYNVPAGYYYLELWVYPGGNPIVYQIQVGEPYADIPQVAVPV